MIKTLTGHLTATNKRHIEQMIAQGLYGAQSARIAYFLSEHPKNLWHVQCRTRESDDWGRIVTRKHFATFEHSPS